MFSSKNQRILLPAAALVAAFCLSGCYGDIRDYCEGYVDCYGGNDADEKACVEQLKAERKAAKKYDCRDKYDDWLECAAEKYKCETDEDYDYDYWTDNGKCDKQSTNLWNCVEKNSGYDHDNDYDDYDDYSGDWPAGR